MKKAVWIIAVLQVIVTGVFLRLMPDTVPIHWDIMGRADNFGSKYTYLIMPAVTAAMVLFLTAMGRPLAKKAEGAQDEKKTAEAVNNIKVMNIVMVSVTVLMSVIQCYNLYNATRSGKVGAENLTDNGLGIMVFMMGLMFIVLGNFMPKTKRNGSIGLRTSSSMYNDTTWRKSNNYAGKALMIAGVLTVITALFTKPAIAIVLMLVYNITSTVASCVYAKKVYNEEISRSDGKTQ